jgi:uncharacterized protein YkwD
MSYLRRKKAKRNLIIIAVTVCVVGGGYWYFERSFSLPFQNIASFENAVTNKIQESISAPPPLNGSTSTPAKKGNTLTRAGVIDDTNAQRSQFDLAPLSESNALDNIASLRLDDMFEKQYFAHVGPNGESAQTVASSVGYTYVAFGENLAEGNFAGDSGVVTAWMNSPGHRANILDVHYSEIGVAVRAGMFDGVNTWIAVQVFGKPTSDCPAVDSALKTTLDGEQVQIAQINSQLESEKAAIDAMQPQYGDAYNAKVSDYNALAAQYNALAASIKSQVAQYNSEVAAFNACIGS